VSIEVRDLTKRFGDFTAVDRVSLQVETGSLVAILGPSGSGKSTLLRMIAGLETPDEGTIRLIGREATHISAQKRNVGFVFQHYALFKHMTVRENIAFGLQIRHVPKKEIEKRVAELVDLVLLTGLEGRYPMQLSGGQRQRVALARALAPRPDVMLLDEPFGALDAKVREELRLWIRRLHDQTRVTTIFVTHDQHEALEIAHQVLVMDRGKIIQVGSPRDIFDKPATPFVAEFVGESNHLDAEVARDGMAVWGAVEVPRKRAARGRASSYLLPPPRRLPLLTTPNRPRPRMDPPFFLPGCPDGTGDCLGGWKGNPGPRPQGGRPKQWVRGGKERSRGHHGLSCLLGGRFLRPAGSRGV
jgi:sulfate transport system ATP-binding protein